LWDAGQVPDTCDLCALFDASLEIRNFAAAGAEIWHRAACDGTPYPDPDCRNGVDRAITCQAQVGAFSTCLRHNRDAWTVVLQFGTNDVRSAGLETQRWREQDVIRYASALRSILAELEAETNCLLIVPPPMWGPDYAIYNARLADIRSVVLSAASDFGCSVADLLSAYLEYEAIHGAGATLPFYKDCPARGGGPDCVHYSIPRPALPAEIIERAVVLPEPSPLAAATCALATIVGLSAGARWKPRRVAGWKVAITDDQESMSSADARFRP
jgi:hypothetical protein